MHIYRYIYIYIFLTRICFYFANYDDYFFLSHEMRPKKKKNKRKMRKTTLQALYNY